MTSRDLTDTDVDVQTFGITLQGELFQRATTVLATLPAWNDRGFYISIIDDDPVRRSYDLVTHYVVCQERLLRNHNENIERWIVRRIASTLMNACLKRSVPPALNIKDQIESAAAYSELHSVALGIIREYENYCSNENKIKAHKAK